MSNPSVDTSWLNSVADPAPNAANTSQSSSGVDTSWLHSVADPSESSSSPASGGNITSAGLGETAMHFASGAVAPFAGGLTYLGTLALTRGDTDAAKAVQEATENQLTYQPRTQSGQQAVQAVNKVAANTIGKATDFLSDKAADLGGPLAGAATRTAIQGAPYVIGLGPELSVGRAISGAAENPLSAARGVVDAAQGVVAPTAAVTNEGAASAAAIEGAVPPKAPKINPATIQYDNAGVAITPKATTPVTPPSHVIGDAATAPPQFETAPAPNVQGGSASTEPAATGPLPVEEQAKRAATLQRLGITDARESAITGDRKEAATDYQQSKVDGAGGKPLSDAFTNERTALDNYTDNLVGAADGTSGLDETSLHNRGAAILQPLQELSDHYDANIRNLYKQADDKAQGMPLELNSTAATLGNRPAFIGTTDGQQLLRGVNAYLRQAGVADETGSIGSATVQQAERLKQYLNDQWSPRTAKLIRGVKDAIDDDVAQSAGGDVYQQARALRAARANTLDNPKGVSSLLESSGPGGINRAVNLEKIPDTVVRMPVDQFGHVVETLRSVPPELAPQAKAALGEIRSQLMLKLQEQAQKLKGAWNNRGVSQYLNANSAKLAKVFAPAELEQLRTLNDAGNILDVDRSYPGAVVQGHNLMQRGAIAALEHGGEAVGAAIGHAPGAVIGGMIGKMGAKAVSGAMSRKAAEARVVKVADYLQ